MAHIFVFYLGSDNEAALHAAYLVEAGRTWNADNNWTVRTDRSHVPGMQDHVHIMLKGKQVSVINKDGTASHGTDRAAVPNWLIDRIKDRGLIESQLIVEASGAPLFVPADTIDGAHFRAQVHDMLR